jgi:hypothetical protein
MPAQRGHELAITDVPEPRPPIGGTGGKLQAVATGLDRQDRVGMAGKLTNNPGLVHVPEPRRLVGRTWENLITVLRRERQRGDAIAVTLELFDRLAVTGRDDSNDLVVSPDSELIRIVAAAERRDGNRQRADLPDLLAIVRRADPDSSGLQTTA